MRYWVLLYGGGELRPEEPCFVTECEGPPGSGCVKGVVVKAEYFTQANNSILNDEWFIGVCPLLRVRHQKMSEGNDRKARLICVYRVASVARSVYESVSPAP